MKQEVIQDFLNLPGIEGLALMDGRSRPYFCGVDQGLNFQQKQALVQGIKQVIDTTPATYQFFQFQFGNHQVYVHKLDHGLILLVMTASDLQYGTYQQNLAPLTQELQSDFPSAIANFRLIAGQTNLGINYHPSPKSGGTSTSSNASLKPSSSASPVAPAPPPPPSPSSSHGSLNSSSLSPQRSSATTLQPSAPSSPERTPSPSDESLSEPPPQQAVTVDEFLHAISDLLLLSADYLGKTMIGSYWKSSRPPIEWLNQFDVNRSGRLIINADSQLLGTQSLTPEQHQWFREWVNAFVQKCSRIIRDFSKIVYHLELDKRQKTLLFESS